MARVLRRILNRGLNGILILIASPSATKSEGPVSHPGPSILFVCFGNICRSPLAEGILRSKLEAAQLADLVVVDSAGTSAYNVGRPPDWRARWCARRHGLGIGDLRARQFSVADFERFDEILVMDRTVLEDVLNLATSEDQRKRVQLLRDSRGAEIADPVNGSLADFERIYTMLNPISDAIVGRLEQRFRLASVSAQ
jgi:protein-tyrosine phosphatase